MPDYETTIQRKNTRAFIDANPVTLVLSTRARVRTPTGGERLQNAGTLAPQQFRLIDLGGSTGGLSVPTVDVDGTDRRVEMVLYGNWDAIVPLNSTFTYGGSNYRVVGLGTPRSYDVRGLVIRDG